MTAPFPNGLIGTKAELFYNGRWNEITEDVRGLGAEDGEVEISPRGQPDESSGLVVTLAKLAVNNANGKYSPRNVMSDLYGLIGPNTPLRISADVGDIESVIDDFNVDSASGWPNAESGHDYTHSGAADTSFTVSGGEAVHQHSAADTTRITDITTINVTDFDVYIHGVHFPEELDEGTATVALRVRVNGTDYVAGELTYQTGTPNPPVNIGYAIVDNGVTVANANTTITDDPGHATPVSMRLQVEENNVRVKGWITADSEPDAWDFETTTTITLPGSIRLSSQLSTGVLNAMPFDVSFGEIEFILGIVLCVVEVSEWPKKWDSTGNDVWVPIVASGQTRRLRQGNKPLRSAVYRYITSQIPGLIGYWDMENLTGTVTEVPSALEGGHSFKPDNSPTTIATQWSANSDLTGSGALPTTTLKETGGVTTWRLGSAPLLPTVRAQFGNPNSWTVNLFLYTPVINGETGQSTTISFTVECEQPSPSATTPSYVEIAVRHEDVGGVDALDIDVVVRSSTGAALITLNETTTFLDQWRMVTITVDAPAASTPVARIWVDGSIDIDSIASGSTGTVGRPLRIKNFQITCTSTQFTMSFGHLALAWRSEQSGFQNDHLYLNRASVYEAAYNAHAGETAIERFERLCTEMGIAYEVIQADDETGTLVGPQKELNIVDLLLEPVRADDGLMYELRRQLGYGFRTRESMYLPSTSLTLDYEATDLSELPADVTDDDQRTRNKVTVKKLHGGESSTVQRTDGPLSTADPTADPPGAGLYDTEVSPAPNLYAASQTLDYAGLRVHLGTWDESRWPGITVLLHRAPFTGDVSLLLSCVFLEIAEMMSIVNTPTWLGPDDVFLQMRAVKIFLSNFNWALEWVTLPAGPWITLGVLSDPALGRLDTHGSTLVTAIDDNDTDLIVWTEEPNLPFSDVVWTEDIAELTTHDSDGIDLRLNPPSRAGGQGGEKVNIPIDYELTDTFTRTASELVGTNADTGQTWVLDDGPTGEMTLPGTRMRHAHDSVNDILWAHIDAGSVDQCVQVDLYFPTDTALTADIECHVGLRHTDSNNNYRAVVVLLAGTDDVALRLTKTVSGSITGLTSNYVYVTNVASTAIRIKAMVMGRWFAAKIWRPDLGDEPAWQVSLVDAASQLMIATAVSIRSRLESGNTNTLPYNIEWDNLRVHVPKVRPAYYDYFNRTVVDSLGTANSGGAWSTFGSGGSVVASDYQVVPNTGTVLLAAANTLRAAYLDDIDLLDVCVSYVFTCPLPTGASVLIQTLVRLVNTNNYMMLRLTITTAGVVSMEFRSVIGGSSASLGTAVTIGWITHATATPLRLKVIGSGSDLAAKVWAPSVTKEPNHWHITATDPVNSSGAVGFRIDRNTGNTNVNLTPTFADFKVENPQRITVDRGENGITREWDAGTDVRLWSPLILGR